MRRNLSRSWLVFLLWGVVSAVALITADGLFFTLAYLLGGLLLLSFLWAWFNAHWVKITRETRGTHSQVGEMVDEQFSVQNTGFLPKLWLEILDYSTLPGHRASFVVSGVGRKETRTHHVRTMSLRRGRFRLGPITVRSGDPFGLFIFERELALEKYLVVYPRTVPLPYFRPLLGELTGGETVRRRTHYVTTNVSGVRDYVPGDSFNRIHWRSTARTGRLVVKEFELDPMADIWLVLDMERSVHVGPQDEDLPLPEVPAVPWESWHVPPLPPSTEAYTIFTAASMAQHFLRQDRAVGLLTYPGGSHAEFIHSDHGIRQEERLLEMMAVLRARGTVSLEQILLAEGVRFNRNTTLMVITPSIRPSWAGAVRHLSSRGVKTTAIVIDPASFGAPYGSDDVLAELIASHIPSYTVHFGDDLSVALANMPGR